MCLQTLLLIHFRQHRLFFADLYLLENNILFLHVFIDFLWAIMHFNLRVGPIRGVFKIIQNFGSVRPIIEIFLLRIVIYLSVICDIGVLLR